MLLPLIVLVAAKKSRILLFLSANDQVCRSWEGAQPGSWPKLASGNIPCHGCHAQFINRGWPGVRNPFFRESFFFSGSFNFSRSSVFLGSILKFVSCGFSDRCSGTGCKSVTGS